MADVTYPVIFSAPMVQALLDGRKVQTRRLAWAAPKHHPGIECEHGYDACPICDKSKPSPWQRRYDKFKAGERPWLWVKETFAEVGTLDPGYLVYRATYPEGLPAGCENVPPASGVRWTPSIHQPKRASRLSLRVTDMRMERLRAISEEDARAEGMAEPYLGDGDPPFTESAVMVTAEMQFRNLWNRIHGRDAWLANPKVIAVTFEIHHENIGSVAHG